MALPYVIVFLIKTKMLHICFVYVHSTHVHSTHLCGICFESSTLSWLTICFPSIMNFESIISCFVTLTVRFMGIILKHKHSFLNSVRLYNCFHHCFSKVQGFTKIYPALPFWPAAVLLTQDAASPDLRKVAKKKIFPGGFSHFFVGTFGKYFVWEHLGTFKGSCQETKSNIWG